MTLYRGDPERVMVLWHLYTWCLFMVGVVSLYSLLRSLRAARTAACLGSLLLYLSPRFFAEGHYNNKDVVLLSFALFTLAAGARLIARPGMLRALAFSLAGAVAANTKVIGALPWGLAGVAMLLTLAARRELTAKKRPGRTRRRRFVRRVLHGAHPGDVGRSGGVPPIPRYECDRLYPLAGAGAV